MIFSFRLRLSLGDSVRINCDGRELSLSDIVESPVENVLLKPRLLGEKPISELQDFVVRGDGYGSDELARAAGARWTSIIQAAFSSCHIGADFGDRSPYAEGGGLSEAGVQLMERETGTRVLTDRFALMTFPSEPAPVFFGGQAVGVAGRHLEHVAGCLRAAAWHTPAWGEKQRTAYNLFSASFNVPDADSRLMLLMMAVETLIEQQPRSASARALVEDFIEHTTATDLDPDERTSMVGTLRWLHRQSVGQAGRNLAKTLGDRSYAGLSPSKFFTRCYETRSQLAHGYTPRPDRQTVDPLAAQLVTFTGDLLSSGLAARLPPFALEGPARDNWDRALQGLRAKRDEQPSRVLGE